MDKVDIDKERELLFCDLVIFGLFAVNIKTGRRVDPIKAHRLLSQETKQQEE